MDAARCASTTTELGVIDSLLDLEEFEVVQISADRDFDALTDLRIENWLG